MTRKWQVLEVVLYLCTYGSEFAKLVTDPEREVRCLALMTLFNLSVVHKHRHRLLKHNVLEKLQPILQVSGWVDSADSKEE